MSDTNPILSESHGLRERLRIEVERRVAAEGRLSEATTARKAAEYERDMACKRLADSEPGVAKVLAQVQEQGVTIAALRAALTAALEERDDLRERSRRNDVRASDNYALYVQAARERDEAREAVEDEQAATMRAEDAVAAMREALATEERAHGETIDARDRAEEWADRLAYAIAPQSVIGEHSSTNNPWQNALDAALSLPAPEGERTDGDTRITASDTLSPCPTPPRRSPPTTGPSGNSPTGTPDPPTPPTTSTRTTPRTPAPSSSSKASGPSST